MSRLPELPQVEDCQGCGVCCLHMGYPAFMDPVESSFDARYWAALPDDLRDELIEVMDNYQPPAAGQLDGPCVWLDLDTRQCKHHEYRPQVCRDFPVGGSGCRSWRWHYRDRILPVPESGSNPHDV